MALMLLDEFESFELISLVIKEDYKELTRSKRRWSEACPKIILVIKRQINKYAE